MSGFDFGRAFEIGKVILGIGRELVRAAKAKDRKTCAEILGESPIDAANESAEAAAQRIIRERLNRERDDG